MTKRTEPTVKDESNAWMIVSGSERSSEDQTAECKSDDYTYQPEPDRSLGGLTSVCHSIGLICGTDFRLCSSTIRAQTEVSATSKT